MSNYILYTRKPTEGEMDVIKKTHDYTSLSKDEFLKLLAFVPKNKATRKLIVNSDYVRNFLWRLDRIRCDVDVSRNKYDDNRRILLQPLQENQSALVIESFVFEDGYFTGNKVSGTYGLLQPRLE